MKCIKLATLAQRLLVMSVITCILCGDVMIANAQNTSDANVAEAVVEETVTEDAAVTEASSGTWGSLEWSFSGGVLTIIGSGEMEGGRFTTYPWDEFKASVTRIVIGDKVTSIGFGAFDGMTKLTSVTMGKALSSIGDSAFAGCSSLSNITWSEKLTTICGYAFQNCTSITSIEFPNTVQNIMTWAFAGCTSLTEVTLGDSVTEIGGRAFIGCPLERFTTFSTNTAYASTLFSDTSSSFTIYGWADSTAKSYATAQQISFKTISTLPVAEHQKIVNVVSGTHVYWYPVMGAITYNVYRSNTKTGTYKLIKSGLTATHYIDTTVKGGAAYYYKVEAVHGSIKSQLSAPSMGLIYVGTPDITSRVNSAAGIKLGWNKVTGATGYAIYRMPYEGTTWTRVATVSGNSTFTWTDASVKANNGTVYKYTIRALAGSNMNTLSGCRTTGRTMARLASRTLNSAAKTAATSIKCSWTTSSAVTGYEVRFMVGDTVYKTVTIGNYKTGVKTFTGLKAGQTYKVQVRSYKKVVGVGSFYSAWSTAKYVDL